MKHHSAQKSPMQHIQWWSFWEVIGSQGLWLCCSWTNLCVLSPAPFFLFLLPSHHEVSSFALRHVSCCDVLPYHSPETTELVTIMETSETRSQNKSILLKLFIWSILSPWHLTNTWEKYLTFAKHLDGWRKFSKFIFTYLMWSSTTFSPRDLSTFFFFFGNT